VQRAIRTLATRGFITTRAGTATKPAAFRCNFLLTSTAQVASPRSHPTGYTAQPGYTAEPPPGIAAEPGTGYTAEPPPTENEGLISGPSRAIDIDTSDFDGAHALDRLFGARPKNFQPDLLKWARAELHGYRAKFPARHDEHPHPPDDLVCAQFLSIAPKQRLEGVLFDLMTERRECGSSYGWFVTVALQRIWNIQPHVYKAAREELKLVRSAPKLLAQAKKMGR
jgi:hypothetical protein